jgi:hypothetical protein
MNLRDIKKDIEYVLSAFVEDCSVVACVNPNVTDGSVSELMEEAIDLFNELRDKVNAKPEGSRKAYYNELRKEVLTRTDALYAGKPQVGRVLHSLRRTECESMAIELQRQLVVTVFDQAESIVVAPEKRVAGHR